MRGGTVGTFHSNWPVRLLSFYCILRGISYPGTSHLPFWCAYDDDAPGTNTERDRDSASEKGNPKEHGHKPKIAKILFFVAIPVVVGRHNNGITSELALATLQTEIAKQPNKTLQIFRNKNGKSLAECVQKPGYSAVSEYNCIKMNLKLYFWKMYEAIFCNKR